MFQFLILAAVLLAGCTDNETDSTPDSQTVTPLTHTMTLDPLDGWTATLFHVPEDAWSGDAAVLRFKALDGPVPLVVGVRGQANHTLAHDWVSLTAPMGTVTIYREADEAQHVLLAAGSAVVFTFGLMDDLEQRERVAAPVALEGNTIAAGTAIRGRTQDSEYDLGWGEASISIRGFGSMNINGIGLDHRMINLNGGAPTAATGLLTVRVGNTEPGGAEHWSATIQHGDHKTEARDSWVWSTDAPGSSPSIIYADVGSGAVNIAMERAIARSGELNAPFNTSITWGFMDFDPATIGWGVQEGEAAERLTFLV